MKLISILALAFVSASCTPETPAPQPRAQIREALPCQESNVTCPLKAGDRDMTAGACIKFLVAERAQTEASSRPSPEPQQEPVPIQTGEGDTAPDAGPANPVTNAPPQPSEGDRLLQDCLPNGGDDDAPEWKKKFEAGTITGAKLTSVAALKQAIVEAEDDYERCGLTFSRYGDSSSEERAKNFPATTAANIFDPATASKMGQDIALTYTRSLLAAAELKDLLPAPDYFCRGECAVYGRFQLVDRFTVLVEESGFKLEQVKSRLTSEQLVKLRKRGMNEFYVSWGLEHGESLKNALHTILCEQVDNKTAAGLDRSEIEALDCHPEGD